MSVKTYQRWAADGGLKTDGQPKAIRPEPKSKLSAAQRNHLLDTVNSEEFKSLPPSQIVPTLADKGIYIGSESTCYRVLHAQKLQNKCGRSQVKEAKILTTHTATGPNQVGCWDITWCPGLATGTISTTSIAVSNLWRHINGMLI